jgi:isocitrate dehydrogenase (NAD+)
MHKVTLIKGDGIGPSIMDAAVSVIEASGVKIEWEEQHAGLAAQEQFNTPLPDQTLESIERTRLVFKGPLTTQLGEGFRSINVVIRENTEGLYAGLEHYIGIKKNIAESIAVITREGTERIIEFAFEYAKKPAQKNHGCAQSQHPKV